MLIFCSLFAAEIDRSLPGKAYIQHLAVDSNQPEIVYAATTSAGIYKSTNRGDSWWRIDQCDTTTAFHVIRIDPQDHDRLICGGRNSGVWISKDQGRSWHAAGLRQKTICDLVLHPHNAASIYVLASDGVYFTPDVREKEWKKLFDYIRFQRENPVPYPHRRWPYTRFQKIAINPHRPQQLLISARWEGGYHRSDDGGKTWKHRWISGMFRRVDPVLFHPHDPDRIYVGTHHQGMFVSYNNGKSWVSMSRGIAPEKRTPFYGAYLISGLVFDPGNPDILYSGSDYSNWKSVNGGITWQELGQTLTCRFARSMAVDPGNRETVYAGTNIGVYRSDNGGNTWAFKSNGFPRVECKDTLSVQLQSGFYRYLLAEGIPAVFRKHRGQTDADWHPMSWHLDTAGEKLAFYPQDGVLALYTGAIAYISTDGGFRWSDPGVEYRDMPTLSNALPDSVLGTASDSLWRCKVALQGRIFFDDRYVGLYYQRPPYVSLQLVSADYPLDKSAPLWQGTFDAFTQITIEIPSGSIGDRTLLLYCEARDFQRNTLVGYAPVHRDLDRVSISLDPYNLLPCFE